MHPAYTQLTEHTAALLGLTVAEIDFDSSLLLQGMESIGLMRTVNLLRKQGVACSFDTLKKHPTLNSWLAMLDDGALIPSLEGGLPASDMSKPFALTPVQQAYWMGRQEDQPLGGNSCQVYMEFQGADLCPERLVLACNRLIERHPMLRAQFTDQGEQHVPANLRTFKLSVDDLRTHSAEQIAVRLNQHRDDYSHYCADINEGWPLRVALSRLPGKSSRLHLNLDLLVADVLSISILLRDLAYYYQHDAPDLAPFTANFSQYLQRHELESDKRQRTAQDYWKQRLPFLPGAPTLPLAQQPEKLTKPRFTRRDYLVKNPQLAALENKAKKQGVTLATVFLTLYCEVLARWSENKHFLLNIPLFNRHELVPSVSDMVADFTSLLLLEVDFRRPASFTERLQQLQSQLHRDITHADYSGVEVLRDLARADGTATRSAPVVFALNLGKPFVHDEAEKTLGQLGWMISQTPQVWIDHQSYPTREGLILNWDSVDALFPAGMVSALFNSWLARLHLLIEQEWDLLPERGLLPETQATRSRINATTESLPQAQLHDGFFAQARRQPDAPAIFTAEGCLSYQVLSQYALQMAHRLQQLGVKPQDRVAINLPKGGEQIAAVLAVLAAGASWVPLAMHHPLARRALICQRAEVVCVITQLSEIWPETIAVYDPQQHGFNASSESLPAPLPGEGESLAYIIYTSGSTGEPKGVAITHRAAWNTIATLNHRFDINRDDRVLALSGLEFDLSVYDIFGLLSAGGAIVMPREDERRDPDTWRRLSQQHCVTLWNSVPALMEMLLLTNSEEPFLPHLRLVWVSGDWVAPDLAQRLRHKLLQAVRIVAMGGATEAAIWSNAFEITPDFDVRERVPYGYPLSNQQFRVMDECECDCPDWVPGELWIGGEGLARGYVGDLQQTAQRFVQHDGQRWYRTGDRGFYSPEGLLHFLGRQDSQIKLDGNRIELAEIESALRRLSGVKAAFCLVVNHHLAAVVTSHIAINTSALVEQLATTLPTYMVPKRILVTEDLPLTPNGKVDRAELSRRVINASTEVEFPGTVTAEENSLQAQLRHYWLEVLDLPSLDAEMSFFQLGGNSLQAMRLVNRINQSLGIQLSLRQFLSHATLLALTHFIESTCPAVITTEEGAL